LNVGWSESPIESTASSYRPEKPTDPHTVSSYRPEKPTDLPAPTTTLFYDRGDKLFIIIIIVLGKQKYMYNVINKNLTLFLILKDENLLIKSLFLFNTYFF